ncbi:MAG TPA: hypothetical protein VJQ09_09365 [Candidatus Limnocylindria bacterium]|nr:hypothetical protein [Candidatus Limnocylindria bacterium]
MRWIVIAAALVVGFFLLSYDQRTDDAGVEAALLVATSLALTLAAPRAALAIALAVGLPIVGWSLLHGNAAAIIVLAFSGIGAAIGYAIRRSTLTPAA